MVYWGEPELKSGFIHAETIIVSISSPRISGVVRKFVPFRNAVVLVNVPFNASRSVLSRRILGGMVSVMLRFDKMSRASIICTEPEPEIPFFSVISRFSEISTEDCAYGVVCKMSSAICCKSKALKWIFTSVIWPENFDWKSLRISFSFAPIIMSKSLIWIDGVVWTISPFSFATKIGSIVSDCSKMPSTYKCRLFESTTPATWCHFPSSSLSVDSKTCHRIPSKTEKIGIFSGFSILLIDISKLFSFEKTVIFWLDDSENSGLTHAEMVDFLSESPTDSELITWVVPFNWIILLSERIERFGISINGIPENSSPSFSLNCSDSVNCT